MTNNIIWHKHSIDKKEREKILKQKGCVIWFTGFSGSGKSTIANALSEKLNNLGKISYILDGDNIRHELNKDLGFSSKDRSENIRRLSEVAKLFNEAGLITITSFISPFRKDRQKARKIIGDNFIEMHVDCPLEVCEKRDPKKLYEKARKGEIKEFTGIDSPYEKPLKAEIKVSSLKDSPQICADLIIKYLKKNDYI